MSEYQRIQAANPDKDMGVAGKQLDESYSALDRQIAALNPSGAEARKVVQQARDHLEQFLRARIQANIQANIQAANWPGALRHERDLAGLLESWYGKNDYRLADARREIAYFEYLSKLSLDELTEQFWAPRVVFAKAKGLAARENHALAEWCLIELVRIREKGNHELHPDFADILFELGQVCEAQEASDRAIAFYRRSQDLRKKTLGENHPKYAMSLIVCARLNGTVRDDEHYQKAETLYREALEIIKRTRGENHPQYAAALYGLGRLYELRDDYARAEPLLRQALKIQKAAHRENDEYGDSLQTLGWLCDHKGDYGQAESYFREAVKIRKQTVGERHLDYAASLHALAWLYRQQGEEMRAEPLLRKAVGIAQGYIELSSRAQSERRQLLMHQEHRSYLHNYLSVAVDTGQFAETAYRNAIAWKGSATRNHRLTRAAPQTPDTRKWFALLQRTAGQLAHLSRAAPDPAQGPEWHHQMESLAYDMEELESGLAWLTAGYRQAILPPTVEKLQAALRDGSALVDFIRYWHTRPVVKGSATRDAEEWRYVAFVVAPQRPVEMVPLGPAAPIDEAIETWRRSYGLSADGAAAARRLRERLWMPIEQKLRAAKTVLIAPEGTLNRLPFAALPGKVAGTYLLEERAFALVPAPDLILAPAAAEGGAPSRKDLLLVGSVDYDARPVVAPRPRSDRQDAGHNRPQGRIHFSPLVATENEIAALAALYRRVCPAGQVTTLRQAQASKEAFLVEARCHRVLHVATHGFFVNVNLLDEPRAGPADSLGNLLNRREAARRYPALLSGLALSGANLPEAEGPGQPADHADGFLTAEEIGAQRLVGVELVVLSACESGLGWQAGSEGVLGLQRSFQAAGARTVVASLWRVYDQATQTLMVEFYKNLWEKKLGKLEALRQAQLRMLHDYDRTLGQLRAPDFSKTERLPTGSAAKEPAGGAHEPLPPAYWAAFVLSGNWR